MAVEVNFDRKAVEFTYDDTVVQGDTIDVRATNVATDDVGTRGGLPNDGRFVLFYPADFTGTDEVEVEGSDSGTDTGTVTIT